MNNGKSLTVYLTAELAEKIERLAEKERRSVSQVVREALMEVFTKGKK